MTLDDGKDLQINFGHSLLLRLKDNDICKYYLHCNYFDCYYMIHFDNYKIDLESGYYYIDLYSRFDDFGIDLYSRYDDFGIDLYSRYDNFGSNYCFVRSG